MYFRDFILTKWDAAVDAGSLNPGKQTFEKMISGMYMGELTRQVLVDMVWEGLMFQNLSCVDPLFEWGNFYTRYVSEIEACVAQPSNLHESIFAKM